MDENGPVSERFWSWLQGSRSVFGWCFESVCQSDPADAFRNNEVEHAARRAREE
jgi:hypothetical protein